VLSVRRIHCCFTLDRHLGLAVPCGIATRETTFHTSTSKPAFLTKSVSESIIAIVMIARRTGTAIHIAGTMTPTTKVIAVLTILALTAIGIA
jgi:hypothetical protein